MNTNRFGVLLLLFMLGGCATSSLNRVDQDNAARKTLLADAKRGDANAQFLLGESYCCGTGFYSTSEAIKWWCHANAQNHTGANKRLVEHLSGDISRACRSQQQSRNDSNKDQ